MSTTSIYRLGRDPGEIGKTCDSWRGAMYVWTDIAKRYFGLDYFPMFDKEERFKIWNAHEHVKLPRHETVVLLTTMDYAVVRGADVRVVADAFEQYAKEHPASSFGEQAAILREADIQEGDLIGWQQTSMSEFWGSGWDEETDEITWYDPTKERRHFDVVADAPLMEIAR